MGVLEFLQIHVLGTNYNWSGWNFRQWIFFSDTLLRIGVIVSTYYLLVVMQTVITFFVNCPITARAKNRVYGWIQPLPLVGNSIIGWARRVDDFVSVRLLDIINQMIKISRLLVQVIFIRSTFGKNENVVVFPTEESEEMMLFRQQKILTTLLIANHRSINDYILINYLILQGTGFLDPQTSLVSIAKRCWTDESFEFPEVEFLSWGTAINLPNLQFFKNLLLRDETVYVSKEDIKAELETGPNKIFALFPEVNILTTEISMMQRKLNDQYFPHVKKFYNVLYPRFPTFINTIRTFSELCFPKGGGDKKQHLSNSIKKIAGARKLIAGETVGTRTETNLSISEDNSNTRDKPAPKIERPAQINSYFYDITIVYYRPVLLENAHDHDRGKLKTVDGFQLEETIPSFLELLALPCDKTSSPVIVMVDVKRYEIESLLSLKNKKLEKWLELQWERKEERISQINSKIKLR
ncbi:Mum3p KNAG_0G03080 [Huiozyma naganishii CBS 8797]|uniref:Phospholipid/glycerol acyltransferase domain-containing protein n=1 Tax=Huiozyma naganishii (strain ATCC MYA-139 / BCRC 22969 / CBS 8797 / KCTC 17520 / NBRC 10181 / NCYC 3082 / Yp74L-3) TaxID=1071383 RepID=J7R918_HUIN7|nr:hypothetical protein KNAG_0G03080 [Kazachstania naganishii CBS 8797]CCK71365.1 hypothetical protein KNAG_0G03080 [Kazachstania naganishii CBS 8797]